MINLLDTTFITAVKIESEDRYKNAKTVLNFLNYHFNTNVLIYEVGVNGDSKLDFLQDLPNLNISLFLDTESTVFHRTKYLNFMLNQVYTKCVCNYDIDVIFDVQTYADSQQIILEGGADILYPYPDGEGQIRIFQSFDRIDFEKSFDINEILKSENKDIHTSFCGHAFFANTKKYKELGGENENFVSYGPEDRERLMRFIRLNAKVGRLDDRFVYHFEHERGQDSTPNHKNAAKNCQEFEITCNMSVDELKKHVPALL